MTYEPPTIEERTAIGAGLIGIPISSEVPQESPAWRRTTDQQQDA
jgi:hypothetical protein